MNINIRAIGHPRAATATCACAALQRCILRNKKITLRGPVASRVLGSGARDWLAA